MSVSVQRNAGSSAGWLAAAGLLVLAAFWAAGAYAFDWYQLDLGSIGWPTPGYAHFLAIWTLCASLAAALLASAVTRAANGPVAARLLRGWAAPSARAWIAGGALAAFVIPLALRVVVLRGAPLTDDEGAYRFMAELLASGRLRAMSPPLKLFFDQVFMINDGHLYAQYFLGWPALMVPGLWIGAPGIMNAVYAALTVPALFGVLARIAGAGWAKLGVVLYVGAPMLMIGAATELSHTSCLCALAWTTWFALRARDADSPAWSHAGAATCFGIAFFIRPSAAMGLGLPLLVWWAMGLWALPRGRQAVAAASFAVPALLLGASFLAVNQAQNGSFTTVSYRRYDTYMRENGYRFSFVRSGEQSPTGYSDLVTTAPSDWLANLGAALVRLNFDVFGWPSSFVFALYAGTRGLAGLCWLSLACFFALHLPFRDIGIDSFGPVHYFETAWPVLLLTVLGVRRATEQAGAVRSAAAQPVALVLAMAAVSLVGYTPVRLRALAAMAANIDMPRQAVARAALHRAVIFAPQPFAPNCLSTPNEHFVHWHPPNDPDLANDVLWVNHISIEQNRRLMEHFPDRRGFVMVWEQPCQVALRPLDALAPGDVRDGAIGGTGEGPT